MVSYIYFLQTSHFVKKIIVKKIPHYLSALIYFSVSNYFQLGYDNLRFIQSNVCIKYLWIFELFSKITSTVILNVVVVVVVVDYGGGGGDDDDEADIDLNKCRLLVPNTGLSLWGDNLRSKPFTQPIKLFTENWTDN